MIRPLIFALIAAYVFTTSKGAVAPTVLTGCSSLKLSPGAPCFMNDVEILPYLNIKESGIINDIQSAEKCQNECSKNVYCHYFTFRIDRLSMAKTCLLKPTPSDQSSPIMMLHKYEDDTQFTYVSGPKTCGQECIEDSEVFLGCGASSPSSCGLLKNSLFDPACANSSPTDSSCGHNGFKCCRDCSKGNCCVNRLPGKVLYGGDSLPSLFSGVYSADQCHTICQKSIGCTHWNFITNKSLSFIGGACYLKHFESPRRPRLVEIESHWESIVGAVDCLPKNKFVDVELTYKNTQPPYNRDECFERDTDIHDGTIFVKWNVNEPSECQLLCQQWPGCIYFSYKRDETSCALKYTTHNKENHKGFVSGPRDCPNDIPTEHVAGCLKGDTNILGTEFDELSVMDAKDCSELCDKNSKCEGWSYANTRCYLKRDAKQMEDFPGTASGTKNCVWPSTPRYLSADDLFPELPIEECVQMDKEYASADIESLGNVQNFDTCRHLCLMRPDCKAISYSSNVCKIKWGGELVDRIGFQSMPRQCPCKDFCTATDSVYVAPIRGLALKALGKLSEWNTYGGGITFTSPAAWSRLTLMILRDSEDQDCSVVDSTALDHCWDGREDLLPLRARVQIIGVAAGFEFQGWSRISWNERGFNATALEGHLELFNHEFDSSEAGYTSSQPASFVEFIFSDSLPSSWPQDMTSPLDYSNGQFYVRLQTISNPVPTSYRMLFCINESDRPRREICATQFVAPPYNV